MLDRFSKDRRVLREAILDQHCVAHDEGVADAFCEQLRLVSARPGELLVRQGEHDNDIYLILAGRVSIQVNGREMAIRQARQHVGEMSLIDPSAPRSASVVVLEETVAAKISEPDFASAAERFPQVWRRLAIELSDRLRQRSRFVSVPNPRPVLFIASSTEGLPVTDEIQAGLSHEDYVAQRWTDNLFIPGHATIADLYTRITTSDFGVIVCTPDDKVVNDDRGTDAFMPRDNVILELGMCLEALGPERTMLVRPRSHDLKIPTDLLGITPIDYRADDPANLTAHIGPVCTAIRKVVRALGVR